MDDLRTDISALEDTSEVILRRQRRFLWRAEYWILAGVALLVALFAVIIYFVGFQPSDLLRYGYAGIFLINFLGAASMVLPIPGTAAVFGAGAVLQPLWGIPVPILLGLVAGLGEALGEFTGYVTGLGGRVVLEERAFYRRTVRFMERYGVVAMFILAAIPNPFFDIVGVAAGATRMPIWRFFLAVLAGKILKGTYIATAGMVGIGFLLDRLG
jgi:membrane protein YqaA with SNARE-associated domain